MQSFITSGPGLTQQQVLSRSIRITRLDFTPHWEGSGRMLDSRPRGHRFEPHQRHCLVYLSKNINPSLVLARPRKTRPYITERLLMGRKESNQTNETSRRVKFLSPATILFNSSAQHFVPDSGQGLSGDDKSEKEMSCDM